MGGIKSVAVSMGYAVLFVILLYLVGIGISSLIQYIKNLEGDNRECSNMYYFLIVLIVIVSFSIRATIRDRKKGGCAGCSGCGGSCSGCHSEVEQTKKSE